MYKLENIEWTQFWRENVNDAAPRILLIGDSITVGYRSIVNRNLEGALRVTAFSTSKAIDNPYFLDEVSLLAKQEGEAYPIIQFNNGLHGGGLSAEEYDTHYRRVLGDLQKMFPKATILLALSTPASVNGKPEEYGERNDQVILWNEKVTAIGKEMGLTVVDLYSVVYGDPTLRTADGYHYNRDGYEKLGKVVAEEIKKAWQS